MRITGDGNVGIGTTTPSYKLDVSGNSRITGNLNVGGTVYTDMIRGRSSGVNLTLMPYSSNEYVQVGYGGTPRDLYVWGNLNVGGWLVGGVCKMGWASCHGDSASSDYLTDVYCSDAYDIIQASCPSDRPYFISGACDTAKYFGSPTYLRLSTWTNYNENTGQIVDIRTRWECDWDADANPMILRGVCCRIDF
jgi:hypothetical protein